MNFFGKSDRRRPYLRGIALGCSMVALLAASGGRAHAETVSQIAQATAPSERQAPTPEPSATQSETPAFDPDFQTNLWSRDSLLGDAFGLRTFLGRYGISFTLSETSEVMGNVTGGLSHGVVYNGLTTMGLQLDTQAAFGWKGGTFNVSAFQIHGRPLSANYLGNLQTASGIEADRATRLSELWFEQAFEEPKISVKIGQQAVDQEFLLSSYSGLYLNTMAGWPLVPSYNLYAGGPAYPLSSLGVRFKAEDVGPLTVLAGVFDDNPPGGTFDDDPQERDADGARFNLNTGALFLFELQYAVNQPRQGQMDRGGGTGGLPGTYKIGAWFDTAPFPDQRYDLNGLSLADPASDGSTRYHRHNYSIYGIVDQLVWQPDPAGDQAVGVFARLMGSPGDRNLIEFSVNAGVNLKAPFEGRKDDTFGIGFGVGRVSRSASALDQDVIRFSGTSQPVRSTETFLEVTYQYQLAGWWQIQPDFQYVFMPGGGVQNPNDPATRIGNEAIFGLRTNITF